MTATALLLRPAEAAELLGMSRTKVYDLISRGELPTVRRGKSVRVHRRLLEEALEREARGGEQSAPATKTAAKRRA